MSEKSDRVSGIASIVLAVLNGVGLLVFAIGGIHLRGRFSEIFFDLLGDKPLPAATQLVISVPSWTVLLVTLGLLGLLVVKELIRSKWIPLCLNVLWFFVGAIMSLLFTAALFAPLVTVIEQMSGGAS